MQDSLNYSLEKVSVLIVNFNSGQWLKRSVDALLTAQELNFEIFILDNASSDGSLEEVGARRQVTIIKSDQNLGFARGINLLASYTNTKYMLLLNPDCLLRPNDLAYLVKELESHPEAALVSGRVFNMDGTEQRGSRRRLPEPIYILRELSGLGQGGGVDLTHEPGPTESCEVEAVSGACMLVRANVFQELAGFDYEYPMHFEDLDLMARIRKAGYTIRLAPAVAISHAGGISSRNRPLAVVTDKHAGLWRYLSKHCQGSWPVWQRPLWWFAIRLHLWALTPLLWWRQRH